MSNIWSRVKQNLRRERLLFLSNIFVMTVTFLLLGIFVTLVVLTQTAVRFLEQQAQVTVFFKDDFSADSILKLKADLESDERVKEISYVSKDDAFKIFTEINKNEPVLLESINPDILPASLEIKAENIKDLPLLADQYQKIDGVEEVKFFKDVIERFRYWSNVIYFVGFGLVGIFFIISYSVVLVTLRTIITSKGKEIEIMKLVGASDNYVKQPLMYQGLFLGMFSSFIAALLIISTALLIQLTGFYGGTFTLAFLPFLNITPVVFSIGLGFLLLLSGFSLGYIGSWSAIKKYLNY